MKQKKDSQEGFTLLELLIVILVVVVFGSVLANHFKPSHPTDQACPPGLHWEYEEDDGWECES